MAAYENLPAFSDVATGTARVYGINPMPLLGVPLGITPYGEAGKFTSGFDPAWLIPGAQPGSWEQRKMPWQGLSGLACSVPGGTAPGPF